MNPTAARLLRVTLFILAFPFAALAQTNATDLTPAFIRSGAVIDQLAVTQISDIVLIRGKTNDSTKAAQVSRIAESLGYRRIANLIVVRDDVQDDAAIVYIGQRQLELEPGLNGCTFRVQSALGIIQLTGRVQQTAQGDLAIHILSKIDGVKEVHATLPRL